MAGWYIRRGEKIVGPVEVAKLQELVAAGRLLPTDELAKDITGPWHRASSTKLFATEPNKQVARSPALVVPIQHAPPVVIEQPPTSSAIKVLKAIGCGIRVAWIALMRWRATQSQRKHELELARIEARALANALRQATATPIKKSGNSGNKSAQSLGVLVAVVAGIVAVVGYISFQDKDHSIVGPDDAIRMTLFGFVAMVIGIVIWLGARSYDWLNRD